MSSSTGARYKAGSIVATNAELLVQTVGFVPQKIRVHNEDNNVMVEWFESLAAGKNVKHAADGTRSVLASGGVEPYSFDDGDGNPGIKIPQLADVNDTTTETLHWEAWG